jgi:hypothetical protein
MQISPFSFCQGMRVDQGLDALHCARIACQALDSSMSITRSSIEGAKADGGDLP